MAAAEAAAFELSDGMVASVEPLWTAIRLWVTVKSWKLYEDLGPAAVDALGLDPTKGVVVSARITQKTHQLTTRVRVRAGPVINSPAPPL